MEPYILIVLFWGTERSSMTSAEFNSKANCEAAKIAVSQEMDSNFTFVGRKTYSVCVKK